MSIVQTEALDNALLMACLQTLPSCKTVSSELAHQMQSDLIT